MNSITQAPPPLFGYRKFWAHRFGPAPFLPMSRDRNGHAGLGFLRHILVTGDAYVDHPSFGMAMVGRLLESQGFRVGIICPAGLDLGRAFKALGQPNLFSGSLPATWIRWSIATPPTASTRHTTPTPPMPKANKRPDRAVTVYSPALPRGLSRQRR
jgi:hypothetical protein